MWQVHNHVLRNAKIHITGGQFFFKVDANDNLNLIYAKSIKTDQRVGVLDHEGSLILGLTQLTQFIFK